MSASDTAFRTLNPATGELLETFPFATPAEIDAALWAAHEAFARWRKTPFGERAAVLQRAAELLRARAGELARTMALEMGKPLAQGEAEANKCALTCEHYAEHAEALLAPEQRSSDASKSYVRFDPLGAVLAIMPWNFPLWQVVRAAAPALMAGNTFVLKHAANVPRCARALEAIFRDAGLLAGAFAAVFMDHEAVLEIVHTDPRIAAVTLTGSTKAGALVAERGGKMLRKCVFELGGSDPFVVLDDADLDLAAKVAVDARLLNSGQSCIAAKRFIATARVHDAFLERFVAGMRARKMGDPFDRSNDIGPLARMDLRDNLHQQVEKSVAEGARIALGGAIPEGPGAFYPPTVLAGNRLMTAFREETFGPVAAVVRARDEAEAIDLANASIYGLGASLWTRDLEKAERLAAEIEAGSVFVNGMVKSDPRLPFGGIRFSGYGRELGTEGIREFVNDKTVWIR